MIPSQDIVNLFVSCVLQIDLVIIHYASPRLTRRTWVNAEIKSVCIAKVFP